jgi:hypothetical protein|uniref:Double Cache domain-containing protein n=1 Tax=Desulfobacca acetoxidans TaxID=60893 RepID=A0A7V6A519_9BACT
MRSPSSKEYLGILVIVLMALAWGPGCQQKKPPLSAKGVAFTKEVQAVINRIGPPLAGPVSRKDAPAVRKALVKAFSVCADACAGMFYHVFILDQEGILTAFYPPAEVEALQFSNYAAVKKAFAEKKPNQSILYLPDGTPTYIIYVPLIDNKRVAGILALGFEGNQVREKRGVGEQEFLSLEFQAPVLKTPKSG